MPAGRPRKEEIRSIRIGVCVTPQTQENLRLLANESQRTLSDYCRFVLEEHVRLLQTVEEEGSESQDSASI